MTRDVVKQLETGKHGIRLRGKVDVCFRFLNESPRVDEGFLVIRRHVGEAKKSCCSPVIVVAQECKMNEMNTKGRQWRAA